jgi:23S rRNA pseudouridine1911/1915/1917 synthase
MENKHSFTVAQPGSRLDAYVAGALADISRTYAQKLIADGLITVNGLAAKASRKLVPGEVVSVTVPPPETCELAAEDIPLDIVYEDKDLLVVNKPAGLTVHPAPGNPCHTLVNALLFRFPELSGEDNIRPGIVHRLDKDTSGLIIVARNRTAHNRLAAQFKSRDVSKAYLALVRGHLSPEKGVIDAPIGRDPKKRQRMAVTGTGRPARTEYSVIRQIGGYTLLEARPKTGRTHQIRVHLASIGHPVVGDATYGAESPLVDRQFLHAYRLGFKLPSDGRYIELESPLPLDLQQALDKIEK